MSGYIKAQRDRFDHPLFSDQKFCRGYAWDWLVASASWRDKPVDVGGKTITLKRGQLCHSVRFIAGKWGWSIAATQRFLTRLKTDTMIDTESDTGRTVITICNYEKYQGEIVQSDTPADTPTDTAAIQQRYKEEEGKKEKKRKGRARELLCDLCSKQVVDDFLAHRKALKAPVTDLAASRMVAKLKSHPDPDGVLNLSIENGWKGIFPDKAKPVLRAVGGSEHYGAFGKIPVRE